MVLKVHIRHITYPKDQRLQLRGNYVVSIRLLTVSRHESNIAKLGRTRKMISQSDEIIKY